MGGQTLTRTRTEISNISRVEATEHNAPITCRVPTAILLICATLSSNRNLQCSYIIQLFILSNYITVFISLLLSRLYVNLSNNKFSSIQLQGEEGRKSDI